MLGKEAVFEVRHPRIGEWISERPKLSGDSASLEESLGAIRRNGSNGALRLVRALLGERLGWVRKGSPPW